MIEVPVLMWLVDCVRTTLTTLYHMHHAATGDEVKFSLGLKIEN